jgi:hypothetical protein
MEDKGKLEATEKLIQALNSVSTLGYAIDRLKDSIDKLTETLKAGQQSDPPN